MFFPRSHASLLALATTVGAFELAFFVGDHCHGQQLGTQHISLSDEKCFGPYVDNVRSVYIRPEAGDENDAVAFYTSGGCDVDNLLASGNTDCIDVDNEYTGVYGSYAVVGGGHLGKFQKRGPPEGLSPQAKELYEAEEHMILTGKNIPVHGQRFERAGQVWRWHQVAHGSWSGVLEQDWDESIHVPSDFFFDYSELYNSSETTGALERRDFAEGVCKYSRLCAAAVTYPPTALVKIAAPWVLKAGGIAHQTGRAIWAYLGTPQANAIAVATGGKTFSIVVDSLARTASNTVFGGADCSTTHDDIDALRNLIELQGNLSACELRLEDLKASQQALLSIVARLADKHPSESCGAS